MKPLPHLDECKRHNTDVRLITDYVCICSEVAEYQARQNSKRMKELQQQQSAPTLQLWLSSHK